MPVPNWLKKEISWKWVTIPAACIGGLLLLSALVAYYFFPQWTVVDLYKKECKAGTSDCERATPLTDSSKATLDGDAYQRFGLDIQFPWRIAKMREWKTLSSLSFDHGYAALIVDSDRKLDTDASLRQAVAANHQMANLVGAQALRSDYDLLLEAAELSPKDFSLWMPRKQAIRDLLFGVLRMEIAPIDQHGFFLIKQGSLRGFQAGTPGQDKCINLLLFDNLDHRAELRLYSQDGLKQAEVNAIVASIKMTPRNDASDEVK